MIKELYIDYSNMIKLKLQIRDDGIKYDLVFESDNKRLSETIISNLKSISTLEDVPEKDLIRFKITDKIYVEVSKTTGEVNYVNKLTTFEIRSLAQGNVKNVSFARDDEVDYHPKTDLHTHFAGAIGVDTLIDVGIKYDVEYPTEYLKKIGVDTSKYRDINGSINIKYLTYEDKLILKNRLRIPIDTQETFNKMEEIYALRGPFTKNKELFPIFLHELAKDYQSKGVKYVELSFSSFLEDKDYLKLIEENLPKIEEETGVKIRFLAGLWRHSDKEWNLDLIDRLQTIASSRFIVGCDYMGHETNETYEFEEELQKLAKYAMFKDPNFVIRIHAGENPIYKTNVYDALKIIYDEHEKAQKESGKTLPMPRVRIGHGLYGLDIEADGKYNSLEEGAVFKLAREMGAIVEFNMSSNLALNNINTISEVPIKEYIDSGVKAVLGTDGHGMYSTSSLQESVLAEVAGLSKKDFDVIEKTEDEVIKAAIDRENTRPLLENIDDMYTSFHYDTPDGLPRWNEEVAKEKEIKNKETLSFLNQQIASSGAITDKALIEKDTKGKIPILISGASEKSWPTISEENRELIILTMQVLANTLNPQTSYIVTGGTNFGVERIMHEAVQRRNKNSDNPIVCLGTVTMEAAQKGNVEIQPNTITHAEILEIDGHMARTWMELPDTQLNLIKQKNGELIAIGGGAIVSDMIQRGHNLRANMLLMDGPEGASTKKSDSLKGNDYSFKTIKELLTKLYEKNPALFDKDFSLDKIDDYIEYANQMISYDENVDEDEKSDMIR